MPAVNDKAANKKRKDAPPKVPAAAILVARIGGTLAMVPAAAISAQTLFKLAQMMNLADGIAWLLPAALDIYAITSIWVGFQIPESHRARKSAIWNARLALALTVLCNALSHALDLASMKHGWSRRDFALTDVSALPPVVVERLLHLQAMIATDSADAPATTAATPVATPAELPATIASAATATPLVAPRVAATPAPVVARNDNPGNDNPIATLVPRTQQLQIVRELVATLGRDVALAEIQSRVGGHKSTASRLRTAVLEELDAEPERAQAVI